MNGMQFLLFVPPNIIQTVVLWSVYPSVLDLFLSLHPKLFYHCGTWTSLPDWARHSQPEPLSLSNTMRDLFKTLHALTHCGPPKCLCSTAALTRQMDSLPGQEKCWRNIIYMAISILKRVSPLSLRRGAIRTESPVTSFEADASRRETQVLRHYLPSCNSVQLGRR
jgi:hypothetical protein